MRSCLTQRIFRQIIHNELLPHARYCTFPLSQQCIRVRHHRTSLPLNPQRRSIFGFSRKPKRQPKPASYETGLEPMVQLDRMLSIGARPPPPAELGQAFVDFFRAKQRNDLPVEGSQAQHAVTTFLYLQRYYGTDDNLGLGSDELRTALSVLSRNRTDSEHETHNKLARLVFEELKRRRNKSPDSEGATEPFHTDLSHFIQILSHYDDALYARDLVENYWDSHLKSETTSPWTQVLRGLIREKRTEELEKTVDMMQTYKVPFDGRIRHAIITYYELYDGNFEQIKKWYEHPITVSQGNRPLGEHTDLTMLRLCISRNELEWGDKIMESLLERNPDSNKAWNVIFQWAAAKGKGVDEIERMMNVMVRRNENKEDLRPDMDTINGLIRFANSKGDPYTAERYVALGQKWGFQPNVQTYLLQLEYRIEVKDLDGAMTAYNHLRGEEMAENEDIPLLNKLIVAQVEWKRQNFELVMGLVEDLIDRRARFEPETVCALSVLHLQRREMDDLLDLLNTHAFHYGSDQRASIRDVLLNHCRDPSTSTAQAWDTYKIVRQVFAETEIPIRVMLMKEFFARNRSDMATHVFGHMRQQINKSQRPTIDTYVACLEGLAKSGDLASLETVHNMVKLDSEIEPNTRLYNALMLAYTGCDSAQHAQQFWDDIAHSREGPTYSSIQIAFQACERSPFGERKARDIWARLRRFDIEVTREIYAAYIGALAGQGLFDECVRLIDNAEKETGWKVDALM